MEYNNISEVHKSDKIKEYEMDNSGKEKEMFNSEYRRGYEDGLASAANRCYEEGFRDGVQVFKFILFSSELK